MATDPDRSLGIQAALSKLKHADLRGGKWIGEINYWVDSTLFEQRILVEIYVFEADEVAL